MVLFPELWVGVDRFLVTRFLRIERPSFRHIPVSEWAFCRQAHKRSISQMVDYYGAPYRLVEGRSE